MSETAEAATDPTSASSFPPSSLPWGQIPKFDPAHTDLRVYSQKTQFLRQIWPQEHLEHLAPRAALLIEGAAFQKIARVDPSKLRSVDGVKHLIEALGGQWGRTDTEDRYDLFERALYMVAQKQDETNDSYLARHDIAFEDLLAKSISINDVRAYVLIRQSALSSEDRKKIIMDNGGQLTYDSARKSLRLLGSRFFQDLQGNRNAQGKKTYDAYAAEDEEHVHFSAPDGEAMDIDEEGIFQLMAEQGDEDAVFMGDFEDQVVEAVQDSPELAAIFVSYQEARARVRERARARGFWPVKGRGKKGSKKGKGTGGGVNTFSFAGKRRSLADRIANSTCRICGQPGHWKRECPQRAEGRKPETINMMVEQELMEESNMVEVVDHLPENATSWQENGVQKGHGKQTSHGRVFDCFGCFQECDMGTKGFSGMLQNKLMSCCRKHGIHVVAPCTSESQRCDESFNSWHTDVTGEPDPPDGEKVTEVFQIEEECHEAILDTGASRAVIGSQRLDGLIKSCGVEGEIKKAPSSVTFRFGNSGTLQSTFAVFFPRKTGGWIRIEVVPGRTPFLLSNSVLRSLRAVIDTDEKHVWFKGFRGSIPLGTCRKNLMCVDFSKVLNLEFEDENETNVPHEIHHIQHDLSVTCTDWTGLRGDPQKGESGEVREPINDTSVQEGIFGDPQKNHDQKPNDLLPCDDMNHVQEDVDSGNVQSLQIQGNCNDVAINPQAPEFSGKESFGTSHESQPGLPRRGLDGRGRSEPKGKSPVPRVSSSDAHATAGHHLTTPVGSVEDPIRKACREDLFGGPSRFGLLSPGVESSCSRKLAAQFSDVLQNGSTHDARRDCHVVHAGDHRAHDESGSPTKQGSQAHRQGQGDHEQNPSTDDDGRVGRSREIQSGGTQSGPSEQAGKQHSFIDPYEHRGRPREDSEAADPDCHSRKRAGKRAPDPRRQQRREDTEMIEATVQFIQSDEPILSMSVDQEGEIHQAIQEHIMEVEGGLSKLPTQFVANGLRGYSSNMVTQSKSNSQPSRPLDILEVYCEEDSQITQQVRRHGGRAMRFTRSDGDLNTEEGIQKLWLWIYMYEPRHVWLAPECRLYGKFANLNMSKGMKVFEKITQERRDNRGQLWLCNEIYRHQVSHKRHAHVEQPAESCMTQQVEMQELVLGTYEACFDMCRLGKLRLPHQERFLRKRTKVRTTSGYVYHHLHDKRCEGNHVHATIQGSMNHQGKRTNVSAYAAAYTPIFGSRIAKLVLEECQIRENPVMSEIFALSEEHDRPEMAPDDSASPKRQRYGIKRPPRSLDLKHEFQLYGRSPTWSKIIQRCNSDIPRVGNLAMRPGDQMFPQFQMMVPEMDIRLILICRGTERFRVPGAYARGEEMPWRKTILVDRGSGEIIDKGPLRIGRASQNFNKPAKLAQHDCQFHCLE